MYKDIFDSTLDTIEIYIRDLKIWNLGIPLEIWKLRIPLEMKTSGLQIIISKQRFST